MQLAKSQSPVPVQLTATVAAEAPVVTDGAAASKGEAGSSKTRSSIEEMEVDESKPSKEPETTKKTLYKKYMDRVSFLNIWFHSVTPNNAESD